MSGTENEQIEIVPTFEVRRPANALREL